MIGNFLEVKKLIIFPIFEVMEINKKYRNVIIYKERTINENGLEQRLIVSYSVKFQEYKSTLATNILSEH